MSFKDGNNWEKKDVCFQGLEKFCGFPFVVWSRLNFIVISSLKGNLEA